MRGNEGCVRRWGPMSWHVGGTPIYTVRQTGWLPDRKVIDLSLAPQSRVSSISVWSLSVLSLSLSLWTVCSYICLALPLSFFPFVFLFLWSMLVLSPVCLSLVLSFSWWDVELS